MTLKQALHHAEEGHYKNNPQLAGKLVEVITEAVLEFAMRTGNRPENGTKVIENFLLKEKNLDEEELTLVNKFMNRDFITELMSIHLNLDGPKPSLMDCLVDGSMTVTSADLPRLSSN